MADVRMQATELPPTGIWPPAFAGMTKMGSPGAHVSTRRFLRWETEGASNNVSTARLLVGSRSRM